MESLLDWIYGEDPGHPMNELKPFIVTRQGLNTVRQGWRSIENGAPIVPITDKPALRFRDGTQIAPFYANPAAPWNGKTTTQNWVQSWSHPSKDTYLKASELLTRLNTNPQFRQGYPYPYSSGDYSYHRVIYPNETISNNPFYAVPLQPPGSHEPKPDVLRQYLPQGRI